jgi:ABC-type multidrug transport system ATPase subunit
MSHLVECRSLIQQYPTAEGFLKLYGEGVSFAIDEGSFVSIVGGSGWGKSTLVNLVLGLETPSRGSIFMHGENVTRSSFVNRCGIVKAAVVFQRPTAVPQLTVLQNLHLALSMLRVARRERDERIKEAMDFFGLENLLHSRPDSLSAGQRRRIDLARALAGRPDFLVLDEPTGDLDASMANLVLPLLRGLNKNHGTTILMTTAVARHAASTKHQIHLKPPTLVEQPTRLVVGSDHV